MSSRRMAALVAALTPAVGFLLALGSVASASDGAAHGYHGIDLRALGVQLLGFTILAIILGKFAYPPALAALRARRERIREGLEKLESDERGLNAGTQAAEQKLKDVERGSLERIEQAVREGGELRQTLAREGDDVAAKVRSKAKVEVEIERQKMVLEVRNDAVEISFAAAERLLRDAVDREVHEALVADFIDGLGSVRRAS